MAVLTGAFGINDLGQVVGAYYDSSVAVHGFLYSGGSYTTLNAPSSTLTEAQGINDAGQIVGQYEDSSGAQNGFLYNSSTFAYTTIDYSIYDTQANGINDLGQIVGYFTGTAVAGAEHVAEAARVVGDHGFLYTSGTLTPLDDTVSGAHDTHAYGINDLDQIVGNFTGSLGDVLGFIDNGGIFSTLIDPLGAKGTFAQGINDAGQIVGYYVDSSGTSHGFLDSGGTYTTIDDALGTGTALLGINNAGQIVGSYTDSSGGLHGFLATLPTTTSYTFTTLNAPSGTDGTEAYGINNLGQVVGNYTDSSGAGHAFLYNSSNFAYSTLDYPSPAVTSAADGINDVGQVVGYYLDSSGKLHGFSEYSGFHFSFDDSLGKNGTQAYDINDAGLIVGFYIDSSGTLHGFQDSSGVFTTRDDPLGAKGTVAYGVNDAGQIVGSYTDSSGTPHGFLYSGGNYTTLDDPLGTKGTIASGVNDLGQIVGYYKDSSGTEHGFLYSGGTYTKLDDPLGAKGTEVHGINDTGQVVGLYLDSSGADHAFLANPSPATTTPPTSVQQEVLGLYAALYNRAADFPGYSFWVGTDGQQADSGGVTVANAGTTAVTLNDAGVLGQAFVNTQAAFFNATYASLTDSQFINALYVNIGGNAGDPGGVAYWQGLLAQAEAGGASVQAARAGLVGQFVHDLIDFDLTPGATALGLTAAQYQQAQTREAAINDKIAVSLGYSNISQQTGGSILDAHTVGDAAYNASVAIIQGVTSDPGTVTAAITGINTAVAHQDLTLI
jgi:probable HAF family extracellular repeat protein